MDTAMAFHNTPLTPSERRRINLLNTRMQRYFRHIIALSWDLQKTGRAFEACCHVHAGSGYYRAHVTADRAGTAMDLAFEKIVRQRRRVRARSVTARARSTAGPAGSLA